jgi:uncharacterized membrane protein|tara:strand:+ start:662 stop:889 length:228 start_codon:yes stop_codon:yes gene_type:complete
MINIIYIIITLIFLYIIFVIIRAINIGLNAKNKIKEKSDINNRFEKLKELLEDGTLNQEEFDKAKKRLLSDLDEQ